MQLSIPNAGFETPSIGSGGGAYVYDPSGASWTFSTGSGLSGNGSGFTSGNSAAPEGVQVAFVQGTGSISQSLAGFQAGTAYTLIVSAAQRANNGASAQTVQVSMDGTVLGTFTASGTGYSDSTFSYTPQTSGSHTLQFLGLNSTGDNTLFLDNIRFATATTGSGQVRYFPRAGYESRMVGGQFQGSGDNAAWTTLYTVSTAPGDVYTTAILGADPSVYRYLRYLSPPSSNGDVAEIEFDSGSGTGAVKITGTGFGTPGSYANSGNDFTKALDGNTGTFFDAPNSDGNFVGIDQGAAAPPSTGQVQFYPRSGYASRMTGGKFQGSSNNSTYTDLYTITSQPTDGQYAIVSLSVDPKGYRYLRYLAPDNSYGNVAEVSFYSGTGASAIKLMGAPFGTPGSYGSSGADFTKVFDGDTTTFFDAPTANGVFAGIDQGSFSAGTPAADVPAPGWAQGVIPPDQSDASGNGPSSSEAVSLPSGVKENTPDPDLDAFNPVGPSVSFSRLYRSALATAGYGSPGLSPGWVHSYDLRVISSNPGAWGPLKLIYPNGAQETWTPTVTGSTATFAHTAGTPYLISGVPSSTTGVWQSLTTTFKDRSTFTFKLNPNAPGNSATYLLSQLADVANRTVTLNYDLAGRLTAAVNDDAPQTALLSLAYTGGYLSTLSDSYNRQITYSFGSAGDSSVTVPVLKTVSQTGSTAAMWQYDYAGFGGAPLLNSVQIASPSGTGLSGAAGTVYDFAGHVARMTDANGNYRTYQYSASKAIVSVYDPSGNLSQQWTQKFDPNNNNVDMGYIDGNKNASSILYGDASNPYRPTSILSKNSGNTSILIQYDAYGNPLTVTDPRQVVTTNTPDPAFPLGQILSVQVGNKTPTKFVYYDGTTQANGITQLKGLVKSVFLPTPGTSSANTWVETDYTYTAIGDVATVTKPGPNSGSGTVAYTYGYASDPGDSAHGVAAYSQPGKHGEPLTVTAPSVDGVAAGVVTHFRYDAHGNLTAVFSPLGNRTDYIYTATDATKNADQLVQVVYPATGQGSGRAYTNINYRYPGGPVASTDIYDESGALARHADRKTDKEDTDTVHSGDIQQAAATYDPRYRPSQIINGASKAAQTFTYEAATGNIKTLTFPLGDGPKISTYDPGDNVTGFTNGRGQTTSITRTADDGRATDKNYQSGTLTKAHYDYDIYDRIMQMTDGTGMIAYTYDDDDRVTSTKNTFVAPNGTSALPVETISYAYNTDGTKASMTTPGTTFLYNGGRFTYTYDNVGRMTRVNTPWVATAFAYTYDGDDRIIQQHTSRADSYYTYNQRGFLTELENVSTYPSGSFPNQQTTTLDGRATPGGRPLLSDFSNIKYDAEGNRLQMTFFTPDIYYYPGDGSVHLYAYDMDGIVHYAYDNLSRLHQEYTSNSDGTATPPEDYQLTASPLTFQYNTAYNYTYNYGPSGNVTSSNLIVYNQDGTNQSIAVNYNDNDQISDGGFFHDADGNATTYRNKGIVYDIENRPVAYDNGAYTMAWNGDGQRAWKQTGTNRTYFLYDGNNVVAELDSQGRMIRTYGYGACGLAQSYLYDYGSSFGRTFTYVYNPAGSVVGRIRSDVSNSICDDVSYYDTFGQLHSDFYAATGGAYPNNLKDSVGHGGQFGQYTDLETQGIAPGTYLSLSGPELYDPNLGRHLIRSGGLNEYQAQALPYTVLSSMGKGFLNAAASTVVGTADFALTVAQLSPMTLSFGQPIYHIPSQFYTPFTVGNSQIERMAGAEGEFGFYALDAYLGASGAIRGGFSGARRGLSLSRRVGNGKIPNCFVAGTLVQMADGTTKPIEQVKVGDYVKSRNPQTGVTEAKRVTETFTHMAPQVLTLALSDPKTGLVAERIVCTPGHPFYVEGKGFVLAGDLGIGTSIVTRAGPCLSVSGRLLHEDAAGQALPERVYNFTVADDHTYFVGTTDGGTWVHNTSLPKFSGIGNTRKLSVATREEAQQILWRDFLSKNGYTPTTGLDPKGVQLLYGNTRGTFHWDEEVEAGSGRLMHHDVDNPDAYQAHVQIHDYDGTRYYVFFGPKIGR